jgi:hypothetical protein
MSDYTPVYVPGKVLSLTVSAAVSGGDLVSVSGSGTVAKTAVPGASTAPSPVVGVVALDTPINGRATVYARGIVHESVAQGTVTAGDYVTAPLNGATAGAQVQSAAAVTTPTALTTASNPAKVRWMEV